MCLPTFSRCTCGNCEQMPTEEERVLSGDSPGKLVDKLNCWQKFTPFIHSLIFLFKHTNVWCKGIYLQWHGLILLTSVFTFTSDYSGDYKNERHPHSRVLHVTSPRTGASLPKHIHPSTCSNCISSWIWASGGHRISKVRKTIKVHKFPCA